MATARDDLLIWDDKLLDDPSDCQTTVLVDLATDPHDYGVVAIVFNAEAVEGHEIFVRAAAIGGKDLLARLKSVPLRRRDAKVRLRVVKLPPTVVRLLLLCLGCLELSIVVRNHFSLNVAHLCDQLSFLFWDLEFFLFLSDDSCWVDFGACNHEVKASNFFALLLLFLFIVIVLFFFVVFIITSTFCFILFVILVVIFLATVRGAVTLLLPDIASLNQCLLPQHHVLHVSLHVGLNAFDGVLSRLFRLPSLRTKLAFYQSLVVWIE